MSQEMSFEPLPPPPPCTRPDTLWCGSRCFRDGEKVCRAPKPCAKPPSRTPAEWSEADVRMLGLNSHLDVDTLRVLLPYRSKDEIRAKLEEVDP